MLIDKCRPQGHVKKQKQINLSLHIDGELSFSSLTSPHSESMHLCVPKPPSLTNIMDSYLLKTLCL